MTVQTDLQTALDAYIQANFSGSLAEVSAAKKPLEDLLRILDTVTTSDGGSITNYALETGGNLADIALATGVDNATIPTRTVLVGGQHGSKIENIKVDQTGAIVVNATGQQSSADSFSVVLASNQPAITVTANAGTNLNTSLLALESGGNLAGINTKLPSNLTVTATRLLVDGSGVTQPVSIASLPALSAGANAIGSITNTSFGISGTLPAFAATPTFNIGTAPNLTITNTAFTANAGTNLNTSLLALENGGNLAGINTKLPASLGAKTAADSLSVTQAFAATSTLANVASSATSVTLLAANNNRKTAIIINDSTSDLYVVLNASAASTTNYSLFLAAKVGNTPSFLAINGDDYSGEIRGIWSSANGFARITEVV